MKTERKIVAISIVFGLMIWVFDTILDTIYFFPGTFRGLLLLEAPTHELYVRTLVIVLMVCYGLICAKIVKRLKDTERTLATEREMLAVTLRSIGDGVITTDSLGKVVSLNNTAEHLTGWTEREASGRPLQEVFNIINEHTLEPCDNPVEKVLKTGQVIGLANHTALIARDGTRKTLADSGAPIVDAEGRVHGVVLVFQDITDRRKVEQERDRLFNLSVDMLTIAGFDGFFKQLNPAWTRTLGWSIEELLSKPYAEFVHPDDLESTANAFRELSEGNMILSFENRYACKDGSYRWLSWNSFPLPGEERIFSVARDVTSQKQTQEDLSRSRATLASIFRAAPTGIGMVGPGRQVTWANDLLCSMTGYSSDEMVGKAARELYPTQEEFEFVGREKYDQISKKGTGTVETRWLRKDGAIIEVLLSSTPLNVNNLAEGVTFTALDITDRKRAERAIEEYRDHLEDLVARRTRELEKAQEELVRKERLAVLGQLTATVSHEIRNPLGTIRASIFSVADALEHNDPERAGRAVKLAERGVLRCDRIIEELMDFTRIRELKPEPTEIDTWLERILAEQMFPDDVKTVASLQAEVKASVDQDRLRRAVVNVLTNALHALQEKPSDGKVLTVTTQVVADRIEIQVTDNGPGVPDDIMAKIFEPLFSTKGFGVGLGLPIVQSIMEQHGGGVSIRSRAGQGATVTLWLPFSRSL